MNKVVATHRIVEDGLEELKESCRVVFPPQGAYAFGREEIIAQLADADAILAAGAVTKEMLEAAPHIRIISNYGAGYDRVDVAAATERGIPVTNIPNATALPTAEMALALLLCQRRNMLPINRKMRQEGPEGCFGMDKPLGHSLEGRRLGVIGMGHIGQKMAQLCQALGMEVVYYSRRPRPKLPYRWMPMDELLAGCDVLTLHCPLTEQTRGLIGARELSLMKPTAVVINTARGAVVDHEALIAALREGRLAGAGLDVFPEEPHIPQELLTMDQVVLMPHYGTHTYEARRSMTRACADRILEALRGERPQNVVNPSVYEDK
jgi:phosphoglycerate dehydrogenase-like enzyme